MKIDQTRKRLPTSSIEIPNEVLSEILTTGEFRDNAGAVHAVHSHLGREHAYALYRTILDSDARVVLEIGMAFGVSTLAILTALDQLGGPRRLVSIDPNQASDWHSLGIYNVERSGLSHLHALVERPDFLALPELVAEGTNVDLAYVDGWHTFDYVLLDFFYIDKLLSVGGIVGFNDCGFKSVRRVLRFVKSHRPYQEMDVGLRADYVGRNPMYSLARRVLRESRSDRYFRKTAIGEPPWDFYARF